MLRRRRASDTPWINSAASEYPFKCKGELRISSIATVRAVLVRALRVRRAARAPPDARPCRRGSGVACGFRGHKKLATQNAT